MQSHQQYVRTQLASGPGAQNQQDALITSRANTNAGQFAYQVNQVRLFPSGANTSYTQYLHQIDFALQVAYKFCRVVLVHEGPPVMDSVVWCCNF